MSTLSLRLPNSFHEEIKKLARREGISINQLVSTGQLPRLPRGRLPLSTPMPSVAISASGTTFTRESSS